MEQKRSTKKGSRTFKPCVYCEKACRTQTDKNGRHKGYHKTCTEHAYINWKPGNTHPNATKGGRRTNKEGYIQILIPGRTKTVKGAQYILEHRWIVQQRLGRPLTKNEIVHHANGIRDDNRDENLILLKSGEKHESRTFTKALQKEILKLQKEIKKLKTKLDRLK